MTGYSDWQHVARFFHRDQIPIAIEFFKDIERDSHDDQEVARAKAWRSYCTINAVLEGWPLENWDGSEAGANKLIGDAHDLAEKAAKAFAEPDYDTLWAWAYAKMAKFDSAASAMVTRAIDLARKAAETGDAYATQSLDSLLAEGADIFIYQGQVEAAHALINESFYLNALHQRRVLDWHHWMRALVLFNKALLLENSGFVFAAETASELYERVATILEKDLKKEVTRYDYEFDALRLRAAVYWKIGKAKEKEQADALELFGKKLKNSKKDPWTAQKEIFRSRYLTTGDAGILREKWGHIARALFPM